MGIIGCSGYEHTIEELRFLSTQMTMIEYNLIKVTVFFNMILVGLVAVAFSSSRVTGVTGLVCFCGGCTYLLYGVLKIVELQKITLLKTTIQCPPQVLNRKKMQSPYLFVGFGVVCWLFAMYLLISSIVA